MIKQRQKNHKLNKQRRMFRWLHHLLPGVLEPTQWQKRCRSSSGLRRQWQSSGRCTHPPGDRWSLTALGGSPSACIQTKTVSLIRTWIQIKVGVYKRQEMLCCELHMLYNLYRLWRGAADPGGSFGINKLLSLLIQRWIMDFIPCYLQCLFSGCTCSTYM